MKPTFWQRMDLMARNLLPLLLMLCLVILTVVPIRLPGYTVVAPMLPVMGVCYWSIVRPDLLRPSMAFGIGVFEDVLAGAPLGVSALVLTAVHGAVVYQQRFFLGKPFFVWWWTFGLVAAAATLLKWVLFMMMSDRMIDPATVFIGYLLTVFLYPVVGLVFARVEVVLTREG
ncbi:MAG: rod shape-determining protein MreD [Alphaproteobacteria bacterium]